MLSLVLFGPPRLERDGNVVHGKATQKKRMALLVALAASPPAGASRDRLVGLLWPDTEPEKARKLLSEAIYQIRRELGEGVLETPGDEVALARSAVTCDLWTFDDARRARDDEALVRAYARPFLDGWYADDAPDFERWAARERDERARVHAQAVERLAHAAERANDWRKAAEWWLHAMRHDPLRAAYALSAARALERSGEGAHALAALTEHQVALQNELDVSADTEVLEAIQRLRAARPAGAVSPVRPRTPVATDAVFAPPVPRRRSWLPAALAGAAIATLLLLLFWQPWRRPADDGPVRIAVLYFRDQSPEQLLGSEADILTEGVISELSGQSRVEIIPQSGVKPFRDQRVSRDSIARALRATHTLEGVITREGETISGNIRLVDIASGRVLLVNEFSKERSGLIDLRHDVAERAVLLIRETLGYQLRLRELAVGTRNNRALQQVQRGIRERDDAREALTSLQAEFRESARASLRRADSILRQAQAEDPRWYRPIIERAWTTQVLAGMFEGMGRARVLDSAIALLEESRARYDRVAAFREALGVIRWTKLKATGALRDTAMVPVVLADLEGAVAMDSLSVKALATLTNVYWHNGDPPRALLNARRALAADAYAEEAPTILRNGISALILLSMPDTAEAWCERGRRAYPGDWQFTECVLTIMKYATTRRPDPDSAWKVVERLDALDPPPLARTAGHAYAPIYRRMLAGIVSGRAGDLARAEAELSWAREKVKDDPDLTLDLAPDEVTMLLLLRRTEEARQRLEFAISRRAALLRVARSDPILRDLLPPASAPPSPPRAPGASAVPTP